MAVQLGTKSSSSSSSSSSKSSSSGDAQVAANQAAAAKLGISIPGVGSSSGPSATSSDVSANQAAAAKLGISIPGVGGTMAPTPPSTISSATTAPATPIVIPPKPPTSTTGTTAMTSVAGTAAAATPAPTDTKDATDTNFETYLKSLQAPPSTADLYTAAENQAGIQDKQRQVNTYQAQLNAITAKAQADKLALTGTGRGIPEVIIGGQQAEIDKEAAIQSLPIAAQLAASQADLKTAQDHLDTLFKLRAEDATNAATYNNKLIDAVYNYASDKQKTLLEDKKTQNAQNFQLMTNNLNYAQSLATTAIQNGQPGIAAQLMKLDHTDPNYAANIAILAKGIVVSQKGTGLTTEQSNAILGSALRDATSAIQGGADPSAVRAAFLEKHPTAAADWNAYFATPDDTKQTYPTPTPAPGPGLGSQIKSFFGL